MAMEKINANDNTAQSEDIIAENITQLKILFPEAFSEGKLDFEVLKQLLSGQVDEKEEKYSLNWYGKRVARQIALTPSTGTLRPCIEESIDWNNTHNVMIEGENLEVLKLLQKNYSGKIKIIYIDPPYNTGKDFVYQDNYQDNIQNYLSFTGQSQDGIKYSSNVESSGRYHTQWLNMIYPRLLLARNLLTEDGMIFISIDDNEIHNLRKICDEVFGEDNFVGIIIINSSPSAIDYGHLAKMHDYALFYVKNIDETTTNQLIDEGKQFKYTDQKSPFNLYPLYNGNVAFNPRTRPNLYYPFYLNPNSKIEGDFYEIGLDEKPGWIKVLPVVSRKDSIQRVWRWGKEKSRQELNKEIVGYKTEESEYRIVQKTRLTSKVIRSLQTDTEISSRRGTAEVEELFGEKVFSFPKPIELIERFINVGSMENSIVLDFFAGSGTTGHATMSLNSKDNGTRRYIIVQLPEPLDPNIDEQKVPADFCEKIGKPKNLAELTKERLRRAANKLRNEYPMFSGDLGFRIFKLDSSNIQAWDVNRDDLQATVQKSIEHLKTDRSETDILYELLLKLGLDLCIPIETKTIAGKTVFSTGAGVLMACLAERISQSEVEPLAQGIVAWHKELTPTGDTTCVFRDSAFENDIAKTNLSSILNQYGITNVRSL